MGRPFNLRRDKIGPPYPISRLLLSFAHLRQRAVLCCPGPGMAFHLPRQEANAVAEVLIFQRGFPGKCIETMLAQLQHLETRR